MNKNEGVQFQNESTSATARSILADALRKADPIGSRAVENETNWRRNYMSHFRRAVEAGIGDAARAQEIASDGIASAISHMRFNGTLLDRAIAETPLSQVFATTTIEGSGTAETDLTLPYRGQRLRGRALVDQLNYWVEHGIMTETASVAVQTVMEHPEWLKLEGDTVVVLGAGAEMSPLRALQRWGADVVALDLPLTDIQSRIRDFAATGAGRSRVPSRIVTNAGADIGANLVRELPAVAHWLDSLEGRLVLGNYCYADGGDHVRVSMAADALANHLVSRRPDTALAYLATPTDVFAVPPPEVDKANANYRKGRKNTLVRTPMRVVSGGRLLTRNYPPDANPGICDSLVPQQGPNYALAKRLQRWRATAARCQGVAVSLNVAPSTRTRSVIKNKALAAAYAGAHRFGVEIFEPATSNTLMAALLVHDLRADEPAQPEPWMDEAHHAAHGGLWTAAYTPRSALGLAAVLGIGALRG